MLTPDQTTALRLLAALSIGALWLHGIGWVFAEEVRQRPELATLVLSTLKTKHAATIPDGNPDSSYSARNRPRAHASQHIAMA